MAFTGSTSANPSQTGKNLIESDRVEGTAVYSADGRDIGSVKRIMLEKVSGKAVYAVVSFGGFLGLGADEYTIPWNKLSYDTSLGGYRTDISESQLQGAPKFSVNSDDEWYDRERERQLYDYWSSPYYWQH